MTTENVREAAEVRSFWREHAALRLPFSACSDCRASVAGGSCAARTAERAGETLRIAFTRLFNAFWSADEWFPAVFEEFRSVVLGLRDSVQERHLTYCLFVELVEAEAERRGGFWGWSHSDVEAVIDRACDLAAALVGQQSGGMITIEPEGFGGLLGRFAALVNGLLKTDRKPYAGCVACRRPCAYRFDVNRPEWDPLVSDFRTAFADPDAGDEALMAVCDSAARDAFSDQDPETIRAASLCFAVQNFAAMRLPLESQTSFSQVMADHFDATATLTEDDADDQ